MQFESEFIALLTVPEARYRARFTFDPNSISIGYSGLHDIFVGRSGTIDVFRVQVTKLYGSYQLRTQARFDSATYTTTAWLPIADAAHLIEIDWQAATSSGANNGYLTLWIDGAQQSPLANLDNDTRRIDEARLGPSNGIDTYTRGTEYFDDFESRRNTYIGPVVPTLVSSVIHKSYYRAGAQLIAMRVEGDPTATNNGLFFLHSDRLGSASLTTDASGTAIARQLYDAWGNIRASASTGSMPTDIGYTGQRLDASTGGLMFYNARYYAPSLNRFISADTIVPEPSNPQTLNRYSYGLNNPVKYTDPTGHDPSDRTAIVQKIIDEAAAAAGNMEMANALYQDAINQAIDLWHIDLGSESDSIATYDPLYGMVKGADNEGSEAGTNRVSPRHPISVGPKAFTSVAWLVSTLKHEGVHRVQFDEGRGQIFSIEDSLPDTFLSDG